MPLPSYKNNKIRISIKTLIHTMYIETNNYLRHESDVKKAYAFIKNRQKKLDSIMKNKEYEVYV